MGKPKNAIEMIAQGIEAKKESAIQELKPVLPTPERMAKQLNHRVPGTKGAKFIPVIDTMFLRKQITEKEYYALSYYRERAQSAEDSEKNESSLSPDKIMGGGGGGHPAGGYIPKTCMDTWNHTETARIERDLGSLRAITRAVAVDDVSLTEWCIQQHGGRERYGPKGNFIAVVPVREKSVIGIALMELRMAARRIVK